jgi:hypothetical protein
MSPVARRTRRTAALLAVVASATAVLTAGCGSDDWSKPHAKPTAIGALKAGFVDTKNPPRPEATIAPRAGSWDGVRPSKGYRVVLLKTGKDAPIRTLTDAVDKWADQVDASLKTVTADHPADYITAITDAMDLKPDLIIAVGNGLVDPLALVTANHLDQQFLVVGAELAEPTHNVTAANWVGAAFRGEGLDLEGAYDPKTFTPDRAGRAIRAGVAAVLHGVTGIVLRIA